MAVWSVPKLGTELLEFLEPVLDSPRTVWAARGVIYAINYDLVCMRSEWSWFSVPQSGTNAW